ncbi:4-Hydroxyphenylpyruvate Dioxygenase-Like Protein, partial [Manis pentadactyla]
MTTSCVPASQMPDEKKCCPSSSPLLLAEFRPQGLGWCCYLSLSPGSDTSCLSSFTAVTYPKYSVHH